MSDYSHLSSDQILAKLLQRDDQLHLACKEGAGLYAKWESLRQYQEKRRAMVTFFEREIWE